MTLMADPIDLASEYFIGQTDDVPMQNTNYISLNPWMTFAGILLLISSNFL